MRQSELGLMLRSGMLQITIKSRAVCLGSQAAVSDVTGLRRVSPQERSFVGPAR